MTESQKNQGSAIQVAPREKQANLKKLFEKALPAMAGVCAKHLPPEKIMRTVLQATSRTPELLACSAESILVASMMSAGLGLEPNTPLQQAYLVPFNNRKTGRKEAQFIVGYRGLITLASQSGYILSVQARAVYKGDTFGVRYGLDENIIHEPDLEGKGEELIAVYSVARFKNGASTFEVMTRKQIERAMRNSQSGGKFGPWRDHFDEMAKKTVIRRHAKVMPMSIERDNFQRALESQARAETGALATAADYGELIDLLPQQGIAVGALGEGEGEGSEASPAEGEDGGGDAPPVEVEGQLEDNPLARRIAGKVERS